MQRFRYLCTGASRVVQVVGNLHIKTSVLTYPKLTYISLFHRTLQSKSPDVDQHGELYKASTEKTQQHISDELKGGQSPETYVTTDTSPLTGGGGKVWSAQHPEDVHIAPLGRFHSTEFIPSTHEATQPAHETTVYATQGELNIADPYKTHTLQLESTPQQLAEAKATSAFERGSTGIPSTSAPRAETVFSPKVFSNDIYSTVTSPTGQFESAIPTTGSDSTVSSEDTIQYETARKGKVYGGQNTTGEMKSRLNENPFNLKEKIDPSLIANDSDIRKEILQESLKYVHEKGWSMDAIHAGIKACHRSDDSENLFYNSYDLVDYFMRDANSKMVDYMNELAMKENIQGNRLLIEGLKYRLKLVIPYENTWEQALAQKGLPPNAKRAWKSLLDLANDAWMSSGDTATDIKWYIKRLSIGTIYRSAEIYMLRDQSLEKIESMNFLERHLGDYQTTGIVRSSVTQSLSDTAQVATGLLNVVRTMTTRREK